MALFKVWLQTVFCCVIFIISLQEVKGSPLTSKQTSTEKQRHLFKELVEMFCVLKGDKSAEDCLQDSAYMMNTLLQAAPGNQDSEEADELEETRLAHLLPLNLAANKRDAFYSDWRRRRR